MTTAHTKPLIAMLAVALLTMGSLSACGADSDNISTKATTTAAASDSTVADTTTTSADTQPSTTEATNDSTTSTTASDGGNPVTGNAVDDPEKTWQADASKYRQKPGTQVRYSCPADGELSQIWGSGPYTDDSSVCVAAVHAGVISLDKGGNVIVKITGEKDEFSGSTAHGVTSDDYGNWGGSFIFMKS